jgi:hypothetical protein
MTNISPSSVLFLIGAIRWDRSLGMTLHRYRISIRITELDQQALTCLVQIAEENNLKYYTTIENAQDYIIFYTLY